MKYSVIIPVYNCVRYLEDCVNSVFSQKTDSDYEIILVDDGSTDGSSLLCDRLRQMHPCVRVIHQVNQGVSAARNTGICAAEGAYLLFLDADDLWKEGLLQHMDIATKYHPDVVQFGFCTFYEDGRTAEYFPPPAVGGETGRAYISRILSQGHMLVGSSCINAHRKDMLQQHKLLFPVGVAYGEDLLFRVREMGKAQSICSIQEPLYLYRRNTESATRNMSAKKMQDIIEVVAEFYHQFPQPVIADYYCMSLVSIAELSRKEARSLLPLMAQNSGILSGVQGAKPRITRAFFRLFGVYTGAKIIKKLIQIKNR